MSGYRAGGCMQMYLGSCRGTHGTLRFISNLEDKEVKKKSYVKSSVGFFQLDAVVMYC